MCIEIRKDVRKLRSVSEKYKVRLFFIALSITVIALSFVFERNSFAVEKLSLAITPSPREHTAVKGIFLFKEQVEKKTNNAIKIEVYHSGELVKSETTLIAGLSAGTIDIGVHTNPGLATTEPKLSVLNMPYLFRDRKHADEVLESKVIQDILNALGSKGVIALTGYNETWRHIFNSRRSVFSPKDMQGLKLREMENPLNVAMLNAMGANATPMAWGEVYLSLKNKTIDGLAVQINPVYTNSFFETGKYLSLTGHNLQQFWYVMNFAKFKSLPADHQKILLACAKEAGKYSGQITADSEIQMVGELILKHGMTINNVDKQPFVEATKRVYDQFKNEYPPDLIEKIRNVGK